MFLSVFCVLLLVFILCALRVVVAGRARSNSLSTVVVQFSYYTSASSNLRYALFVTLFAEAQILVCSASTVCEMHVYS